MLIIEVEGFDLLAIFLSEAVGSGEFVWGTLLEESIAPVLDGDTGGAEVGEELGEVGVISEEFGELVEFT